MTLLRRLLRMLARRPDERLEMLEKRDAEVRSQAAIALKRASRVLAAGDGFRKADAALKRR